MTEPIRSALIFGARNLGRAIIETLVEQGGNVAGAARSDETLANITAAGALALRSDITDQAAVRATAEEAKRALGGMDLIVNAAAEGGRGRRGLQPGRSSGRFLASLPSSSPVDWPTSIR
jgi:NAD(P)-dependent dehydrogenase (short-subunit alcohol dehydrogenase family)